MVADYRKAVQAVDCSQQTAEKGATAATGMTEVSLNFSCALGKGVFNMVDVPSALVD
ncbi:MAG: hypothetical protein JWR69_2374 [Pedosphaera sp.]|nr:hypothetical protein [Pedosphaera sp.]